MRSSFWDRLLDWHSLVAHCKSNDNPDTVFMINGLPLDMKHNTGTGARSSQLRYLVRKRRKAKAARRKGKSQRKGEIASLRPQ